MPRAYQQRSSSVPLSKSVTVIDQGRFALIDFSAEARTSAEDDGLAIVEGTSIVEMLPTPLAMRATAFSPLDGNLRVGTAAHRFFAIYQTHVLQNSSDMPQSENLQRSNRQRHAGSGSTSCVLQIFRLGGHVRAVLTHIAIVNI